MSNTPTSSSSYELERGYSYGTSGSSVQPYSQYESRPRHNPSHITGVGHHVQSPSGAVPSTRYGGHPPSIGGIPGSGAPPPPSLPSLPPLSGSASSSLGSPYPPPLGQHHRPAHQAFLPPLRGQPQALVRGIPENSPQEVLASLSLHHPQQQHNNHSSHHQDYLDTQHQLQPHNHSNHSHSHTHHQQVQHHQQYQHSRHQYPYPPQQHHQHLGGNHNYDPATNPHSEEGNRGRNAAHSQHHSHRYQHNQHLHHRQSSYNMAAVANGGTSLPPHHPDEASPSPTASNQGERDRKSSPPRSRLTEQEKKNNHIASEQKRRNAIRDGFDKLTELIPGCEGQGRSEGMVLGRSIEYINDCLEERRNLIERIEQLGGTVPPELRKFT